MYWNQFEKDFSRLLVKTPPEQSAAPAEFSHPLDSIAASLSGDDRHDVEKMTPNSPDDSGERSDSSLHLSC
ncbi:hypothetical protein [uncultured Rhodoblastus sp.]|jgi:hypothetical protein|uniref:hypothetical protein n=1 Tax=uncultured Rhodoblastus sp. TaxID=543037 RepID=UPI0025DED125|nr:hypothetical protein [uncultured Rhodoblastus sp.]